MRTCRTDRAGSTSGLSFEPVPGCQQPGSRMGHGWYCSMLVVYKFEPFPQQHCTSWTITMMRLTDESMRLPSGIPDSMFQLLHCHKHDLPGLFRNPRSNCRHSPGSHWCHCPKKTASAEIYQLPWDASWLTLDKPVAWTLLEALRAALHWSTPFWFSRGLTSQS
jgi:hypothetical protein